MGLEPLIVIRDLKCMSLLGPATLHVLGSWKPDECMYLAFHAGY